MTDSNIQDPVAVVTTLYRTLLAREPDPDGLAYHVGALRSLAQTPESLALAFIDSEEYRKRQLRRRQDVWISTLDCTFVLPEGAELIGELQSDVGYEPWVLPYFLETCRPGMTVLDIGASWGAFSLPAARRVGETGAVFAVEVSPWNCQILLKSLRASSLTNVRVLPLGVSDRLGYELLQNQWFTNNNTLTTGREAPIDDTANFTVVPVLPLDSIRDWLGHIDILKMDIEGMEYRFAMGALGMLKEHRPVVFTEYSPRFQTLGSGVDGSALLLLFLNLDYEIEILHRARPREMVVASDTSSAIEHVDAAWRRHVAEDQGTHLDLCLHPPKRAH